MWDRPGTNPGSSSPIPRATNSASSPRPPTEPADRRCPNHRTGCARPRGGHECCGMAGDASLLQGTDRQSVKGCSVIKFAVTNANTGEDEEEFASVPVEEIPAYIDRAHEAFLSWKETPLHERAAILRKFADLVDANAAAMTDITGRESGNEKKQGYAAVDAAAALA